jgi:hypothetical protein
VHDLTCCMVMRDMDIAEGPLMLLLLVMLVLVLLV